MATPNLQMLLTYEEREPKREGEQLRQVRELMQDGKWRTLRDVQKGLATFYELPSISARLRGLRKIGFVVNRKKIGTGLFAYQAQREN